MVFFFFVCVCGMLWSPCVGVSLRAGGEREEIYVYSNQGSPTVWPQAWVWQLTGTLLPLTLAWFGKASLGWEPGQVEVGVSGCGQALADYHACDSLP